jgi:DNA-binding XRE family transcriptional regulator
MNYNTKVNRFIKEKGIIKSTLARVIGVSRPTLDKWLKQDKFPEWAKQKIRTEYGLEYKTKNEKA